jgi:uncharacterized protein involved in exopolysaccharide biosynthesis
MKLENKKTLVSQLVKDLELAKITLRKETPLIQVINVPIYPLQKDKPGRLSTAILGAFLLGFVIIAFYTLNLFYKYVLRDV